MKVPEHYARVYNLFMKFDAAFCGVRLEDAIEKILFDADYQNLTAEEKAVFAMIVCLRAR